MLSIRGSAGRKVGVTGVCGYPRPRDIVGQESIRSVKGELSTVASLAGHKGVSNAVALPKLLGLSQSPGGPGIKHV